MTSTERREPPKVGETIYGDWHKATDGTAWRSVMEVTAVDSETGAITGVRIDHMEGAGPLPVNRESWMRAVADQNAGIPIEDVLRDAVSRGRDRSRP